MAVNTLQTIFSKDLQEKIFPGLDFTQYAQNHDAYVVADIVSVPNYVGAVSALKNPTTSGTASTRSDAALTYNIDMYGTNPTRIELKEDLQTVYDLRSSTVNAHAGSLIEIAKDNILFSWASGVASGNVFPTSGATSSDNLANGATGVRKKLTKEDLRAVAKQMDKDRMPKDGRYVMIPSDMYYELFSDAEILSFQSNNTKPMTDGVVSELFGLNILTSDQVIYFGGSTLIETSGVASATAGTLNHGALAWSNTAVAKAFKSVEAFIVEKDAKNFGASFFSAGIFVGAKALRGSNLDNSGVYAIKQA